MRVEKTFECGICLDTQPINKGVTYGCSHMYCNDCVDSNLSTSITEGLIDTLSCPFPECKTVASESMIRKIVSEEIFTRYQDLQIKQGVSLMDDVVSEKITIIQFLVISKDRIFRELKL